MADRFVNEEDQQIVATGHECCVKTFATQEEETCFHAKMEKIKQKPVPESMQLDGIDEPAQKFCTCSVIDLIC